MPKILVVGTESFDFPLVGENADYGEQVTDWASAVTEALTTVQQPNDIVGTTASIANNQPTFVNIPGFSFDSSEVVSINSDATVQRSTDSVVVVENFSISGNYNGTNWFISVSSESEDDAGVEFNITSSGQVQYKSSLLAGANYSGSILFRAKVFNDV